MLGVKTKEYFSKNLHENRVQFPEERNAFVLDHQNGRRDVTCKPAITVEEIHLAASIYVIFQHVLKPKPYEKRQAKVVHCFVS